ncbi:CAMTA transcription factor [Forsythia ovata]|uniref:CAMTA transcription factor n=1 Tax=Forsythia ovata TaxID=205694 RepID=A0ABD1WCY7_9LAMI
MWINYIITDSLGLVDDQTLESSISARYQSFTHPINDNHGLSVLRQIFNITDVSPSWGLSNEETKVLLHLSGEFFHEGQPPIPKSNVFLVCGDSMVGMFCCSISPQSPESVYLYLSFDDEGLYTVPHLPTLNLPPSSIAENQSLPSQLSPSHHPLIVTGETPSLFCSYCNITISSLSRRWSLHCNPLVDAESSATLYRRKLATIVSTLPVPPTVFCNWRKPFTFCSYCNITISSLSRRWYKWWCGHAHAATSATELITIALRREEHHLLDSERVNNPTLICSRWI